ncbi:MAG: polyprenyl synthetase family protein [Pirellulales bacterium]
MTSLIDEVQDATVEAPTSRAAAAGRDRLQAADCTVLYAPVADELVQVEAILERELVSRDPLVNELLRHGVRLGGKRLRPALLLLAAKACGEVNRDHLLLAAVLEMIHLATLVHDDVLDEATVRRHHETLNVRAGNQASVLVGDFLFSHSFYLASTLESTHACQRIGRTTNIVCEGEMSQIQSSGDFDISEQRYFEIIGGKTAELCACCCELGAFYADANSTTVFQLREFGQHIGIAFQIADDLLDLLGEEHQAGKSLGTDLDQAKLTLPLIHLLANVESSQRQQIQALLKQPNASRATLLQRMCETGSLQYARDCASQRTQAARDCLSNLPTSAATQSLNSLTQFVLTREH